MPAGDPPKEGTMRCPRCLTNKSRTTGRLLVLVVLSLAQFAAGVSAVSAQPAAMVADIATSGDDLLAWLFTSPIAELDGVLYFFADDGILGRELWRSDGTEAGTWMVRDICPGACFSVFDSELVTHQGALYFAADDGVHGRELWRSDGTGGGTVLVRDLAPGLASSRPRWLTPLGDDLLFAADDPLHGRELWSSDGTAGGTALVADIDPTGSSDPASFVAWNGAVWFGADDGVHGAELWTSDGTSGGTRLVEDILPGAGDGYRTDQIPLTHLYTATPLGSALLFPANDGVHGDELWRTDGTSAGTAMVADIETGSDGSSPLFLTALDGFVYFRARQSGTGLELWRSDGTTGGTSLFVDIDPGPGWGAPGAFYRAGGRLFFPATTSAAGRELWSTDGTPGGTAMARDVDLGGGSGLALIDSLGVAPFGDRVLFQADDGTHGVEPWISDGTVGGTMLLSDVNPGSATAFPWFGRPLVSASLGDRALFFAWDEPGVGWELYGTDGTPGGTGLVRDIDQQSSSITTEPGSTYTEMVDVAGKVFFYADDGPHGLELWTSDGTAAGTHLVRDLVPGDESGGAQFLTPLADILLFSGRSTGSDRWLFRSDGTEAGTVSVVAGAPSDPWYLTAFGDAVYFSAEDAGGSRSLWRSDGTAGGTTPFPVAAPVVDPHDLVAGPDRLDFATPSELWTSAGDAASTRMVANVEAFHLTRSKNLTFFLAEVMDGLGELWATDGTSGGTHRVLDVKSGPEGAIRLQSSTRLPRLDKSPIAALVNRDGAFFVADDGIHGSELWWSDGTASGTHLVRDLRPGPAGAEPRYLTVVRDLAFFSADDGVHGAELWVSDGSEAGTRLLGDLEPGSAGSVPTALASVYGDLFFSAWRSSDGRELWRSDGTPEGTVRVQDIAPGASSSSPAHLTVSGGRLFVTATDGVHGFEPWAMEALPPQVVATKQVNGDLRAGGQAVYTITLQNPGDFDQRDNPGDELVDELAPELTVTAVQADAGIVSVDADRRTVRWNGAIAAGETVSISVSAAISLDARGTTISNQARIAFDGDGSGTNESLALSDDPAADGGENATAFVAGAPRVADVPMLRSWALGLLGLLMALAGLAFARR